MQHEEDICKSTLVSYNETPEKAQGTPRDRGSDRREMMRSRSQEFKRRIHYTPHNNPDEYQVTPQSSGSSKNDAKLQTEISSAKRKSQQSHNETLDKVQKTCSSGKFVDTLIAQWSKHMGVQPPQFLTAENPLVEELKRKCAMEERKVQVLHRKLMSAEATVSSLSTARDAEIQAKEEILSNLSSDWETITVYLNEISESLKGFQQHKDNLSSMYNDTILMQHAAMKKLKEELNNIKLKEEEQRNIVAAAESKVANQEKIIQELTAKETELKKEWEDVASEAISEKNRLNQIYTEEKLQLIKEQEKLTSANEELQLQLKLITEEKQYLTDLFERKEKELSKLQEEILACKNENENLARQNTELNVRYEKIIEKEAELRKQLESKVNDVDRLRENLNARQEIESSLAKDLDVIGDKYNKMLNDFISMENKLKEADAYNSNLERSMLEMKNNNEILKHEKEKILLIKQTKIQDLEKSNRLLQEKYDKEISVLKKDFDTKLATQSSAFLKLSETLNKMTQENQNKPAEYDNTKENENNVKGTERSITEVNMIDASRMYGIGSQRKTNPISETKQPKFQSEQNIGTQKIEHKDKGETLNRKEKDEYNFNLNEVSRKFDKVLSPLKQGKREKHDLTKVSNSTGNYLSSDRSANTMQSSEASQVNRQEDGEEFTTQKKKIFKTRNIGLRQYGVIRKTYKK
ncbi:nucleoprotein TPR-like [Hylaeus volcanicus]|uniref:nucleoprotein TPR-like n=1 Tax=Hylaeus volcanicus TaxID=313075 RepID=UPI0023B7E161|nr:nucleoprotein TPR-like [Hylaeus volcanicus]